MQYDPSDVMRIEAPRNRPFPMSNNHPLLAGRLLDGRRSYVFDLHTKDGLEYEGSGPTPEEARFLKQDMSLHSAGPSLSDRLYVRVLRYDPDAYMHCEYHADKLRTQNIGIDPTGPFSWVFERNFEHNK